MKSRVKKFLLLSMVFLFAVSLQIQRVSAQATDEPGPDMKIDNTGKTEENIMDDTKETIDREAESPDRKKDNQEKKGKKKEERQKAAKKEKKAETREKNAKERKEEKKEAANLNIEPGLKDPKGEVLLDISDDYFKLQRIPGIKIARARPETLPSKEKPVSDMEGPASMEKGDKKGLFGWSKKTTDVAAKVILVLIVILIFILYRYRTRDRRNRVLRRFPKG